MSNRKKKKKEAKEIVVEPFFLKREEELFRDTTELESQTVSKVSARIGQYLSWIMTGTGALALFFFLYLIIETSFSFQGFEILLSAVIGCIGALNVLCGLLLLTKE